MKVYVLYDVENEKFLAKAYTEKRYAMSARLGKLELSRIVSSDWHQKSQKEKQEVAKNRYKVYEISGEPVEVIDG